LQEKYVKSILLHCLASMFFMMMMVYCSRETAQWQLCIKIIRIIKSWLISKKIKSIIIIIIIAKTNNNIMTRILKIENARWNSPRKILEKKIDIIWSRKLREHWTLKFSLKVHHVRALLYHVLFWVRWGLMDGPGRGNRSIVERTLCVEVWLFCNWSCKQHEVLQFISSIFDREDISYRGHRVDTAHWQ